MTRTTPMTAPTTTQGPFLRRGTAVVVAEDYGDRLKVRWYMAQCLGPNTYYTFQHLSAASAFGYTLLGCYEEGQWAT